MGTGLVPIDLPEIAPLLQQANSPMASCSWTALVAMVRVICSLCGS